MIFRKERKNMKTTLNPFENAKRTAQGTGGVSPSVIEEIQAEITVLGSQNETQAQDITDIKAQLEELAGAYSTTEHKTGRKWIDGKDIYEKTVDVGALPNATTKQVAHGVTYDKVVSLRGICSNSDNAFLPLPAVATSSAYAIELSVDTTNIVITTAQDRSTFSGYVILEYTKTGA